MVKKKYMPRNTGRLKKDIDPRITEILFGRNINDSVRNELPFSTRIDLAHVIMLMEQKIIPWDNGVKLLKEIVVMRRKKFSSLLGKPATKDWYLTYESELIQTLGVDVGGSLHTARSRNDLYATVFRLKLRSPFATVIGQALDLRSTLLHTYKKHGHISFLIHTQMQPALPSTYGHYLLAVDQALSRDIDQLIHAFDEIDSCPLGAGAVGGTSFPINQKRTAKLLGFKDVVINSIDAVATYNYILRILSALSILGVTISRLTTDLHLWVTKEYSFFTIPETLVGSSSMMPQKVNPFVLEHIKGKMSSTIGYLSSATAAMQKVPFTNAIEVKKEGAVDLWYSLEKTEEALLLLKVMIKGLTPQKDIMLKHKEYLFTASTALTEHLVKRGVYSFREAHHVVGELVREALEKDTPLEEITLKHFSQKITKKELEKILDFSTIIPSLKYGGGPGADSEIYQECIHTLDDQYKLVQERLNRWRHAEELLDAQVAKYIR